ncbi:MAG: hypothetical protein NVSMB9_28050 [Isosphaeraceae bacterium]
MILQGRVTIDGQVVRELGTRVDPRAQQVALDGQRLHGERSVYYAVHKPKGYVATNNDPAGKPRVIDLLPEIPQRVYAVGRLDEQSTGLMLLTNDGELANKLAHPRFGVEKVYRVFVAGEPAREMLDQLTQGIWLAEGKVRAKRVKLVGRKGHAAVMEMVLAEGKNREIRRMLAKLGHKVMSLTRIAVGPVGLKGLGVGECRPLNSFEVDLLRKVAAGLVVPTPHFADRRERIPRPSGSPTGRRPTGRPEGAPAPISASQNSPGHFRPPSMVGRPAEGNQPLRGDRTVRKVNARPEAGRGTGGPPPRPERPPQRPSASQEQRPSQSQGRRPAPQGQGPAQGQRHNRGPSGRGRPAPPAPPLRVKRTATPDAQVPSRKIIGLEPDLRPAPGGPGVARPRPRPRPDRPVRKRSPRAAQGIKRPPKPGGGSAGD